MSENLLASFSILKVISKTVRTSNTSEYSLIFLGLGLFGTSKPFTRVRKQGKINKHALFLKYF